MPKNIGSPKSLGLEAGHWTKMTSQKDQKDLDMSDHTWRIMEEAVPVLAPLAMATELLTREDQPTVSQTNWYKTLILLQLLVMR